MSTPHTFTATPLDAYPDLTPRQRVEMAANPNPVQDGTDPRELANLAATLKFQLHGLAVAAGVNGADRDVIETFRGLARVATTLQLRLNDAARAL